LGCEGGKKWSGKLVVDSEFQKDMPPFQGPERAGLLGEYTKQKGGVFFSRVVIKNTTLVPTIKNFIFASQPIEPSRRSMDQRTLSTPNFERSLDATMSSASDTKALCILKGPEDWLT
jgi:hypothetical protein